MDLPQPTLKMSSPSMEAFRTVQLSTGQIHDQVPDRLYVNESGNSEKPKQPLSGVSINAELRNRYCLSLTRHIYNF